MKITKKGQSGHSEITDKLLGDMVRAALLEAHAGMSAPLRHIARDTGISYSTVGKWYKYGYTPKSSHLLIIAALYPQVLQLLFELTSFGSLWEEAVRIGIVETMHARLNETRENRKKSSMTGDKSVTIRVRLDAHSAVQLNQRQLWFLGQLQQGYRISGIIALMETWHTHSRTAKRDIAGLIRAGLICSVKQGRKSCYELT
jgi:hypothetical protein